MDEFPPFPGFRAEAFQFLRDLKENNERDWFKPRKSTFDDELLWPLRCLVADASRAAAVSGIPLRGEPSKSVFRIYRDTRFSKNKDPYKTHLGAVLSRTGCKKSSGGLYIHIEPGGCFVVVGFWQPEKELLRALREHIAEEPDSFRGALSAMPERELLEYPGRLKRLPRGFEYVEDPEVGDFLKQKGFLVQKEFADSELESPSFTNMVLEAAREMRPILDWGWQVEDALANGD